MKQWVRLSNKYGTYAGGLSVLFLILGLLMVPLWTLAFNIPLFILIVAATMYLVAKKIEHSSSFVGFNNMLKPLLRTFVIALLLYHLGFILLEYFVFTDLEGVRNELSLKLLDRFGSFLDEEQVALIRQGIEEGSSQSGFSFTGTIVSLALFFSVFGLPLSIFIAALVNKGFSNEEKIIRNERG